MERHSPVRSAVRRTEVTRSLMEGPSRFFRRRNASDCAVESGRRHAPSGASGGSLFLEAGAARRRVRRRQGRVEREEPRITNHIAPSGSGSECRSAAAWGLSAQRPQTAKACPGTPRRRRRRRPRRRPRPCPRWRPTPAGPRCAEARGREGGRSLCLANGGNPGRGNNAPRACRCEGAGLPPGAASAAPRSAG